MHYSHRDKADYLFFYSSAPAPRMLDRAKVARDAGRRVVIAYLRRAGESLVMDFPADCEVIGLDVRFQGVGPRRLLAMPRVFKFARRLEKKLIDGADIYTDTPDVLLAIELAAALSRRRFRFRHEIRDLHDAQLAHGVRNVVIDQLERLLLRRVDKLILTSQAFDSVRYSRIFRGNRVILENWPELIAWEGFRRAHDDCFTVGFVGVVRYMKTFPPLIASIKSLVAAGVKLRLVIAGGGYLEELRLMTGNEPSISVVGPFSYAADVQSIYRSIDLIYSVYDTSSPNVRLALPNKLYESILSRIPILVAAGTHLEDRVRDLGIGSAVAFDDEVSISEAILTASRGEGWYRDAEKNLQKLDYQALYDTHVLDLNRAVLG